MPLAEVEIVHSRPIAPTRRVALGDLHLPMEPEPGFGRILLGAIVAAHIGGLDPDLHDDLAVLMAMVERGESVSQPRLRHRFQVDTVGLQRSVHRLHGRGEVLELELDEKGAPIQQVLGAVYAVATLAPEHRRPTMDVLRRGMRWSGDTGPRLLSHLAGRSALPGLPASVDPTAWALGVFDLHDEAATTDRQLVQQRFRELLRAAHPDHGGASDAAAQRIAELAEARRILLT